LDAKNVAFKTQLVVNWVLLDVAAVLMFYLSFRVKNSAEEAKELNVDDIKAGDESKASTVLEF
ncbi:hypothetical protein IWW47_003590, partial [Coemansia sp. RSA 2052]